MADLPPAQRKGGRRISADDKPNGISIFSDLDDMTNYVGYKQLVKFRRFSFRKDWSAETFKKQTAVRPILFVTPKIVFPNSCICLSDHLSFPKAKQHDRAESIDDATWRNMAIDPDVGQGNYPVKYPRHNENKSYKNAKDKIRPHHLSVGNLDMMPPVNLLKRFSWSVPFPHLVPESLDFYEAGSKSSHLFERIMNQTSYLCSYAPPKCFHPNLL